MLKIKKKIIFFEDDTYKFDDLMINDLIFNNNKNMFLMNF